MATDDDDSWSATDDDDSWSATKLDNGGGRESGDGFYTESFEKTMNSERVS